MLTLENIISNSKYVLLVICVIKIESIVNERKTHIEKPMQGVL
jgi:hypothetical protein